MSDKIFLRAVPNEGIYYSWWAFEDDVGTLLIHGSNREFAEEQARAMFGQHLKIEWA